MDTAPSKLAERDGKRIDLLRVARRQRWLIGVIALQLLLVPVYIAVLNTARLPGLGWFMYLSTTALGVVQASRLRTAAGGDNLDTFFVGIWMFVPVFGFFLLTITNHEATVLLRGAGASVGFFGVSSEEMHKLVEGACPACGYDLRGITATVCPECGAGSEPHFLEDTLSQ